MSAGSLNGSPKGAGGETGSASSTGPGDRGLASHGLTNQALDRQRLDSQGPGSQAPSVPKRSGAWEVDVAAIAGSLVHEIKNPLSTLNINAQLLLEDFRDAATPRELRAVKRLKVMISEVERLERIMDSFLRFTERHELNLHLAGLNGLLEELSDFVTAKDRKKGVAVRFWPDPQLPQVYFDPDLMRQVFLNLVINAENAMEEKGGELILRTRRLERDGRTWAVADVIDTGHGIPPHIREKIFNLYFSTRKDGTGLGLSTSKRIVEEHGGTIEIQTEEGKGSQFSVLLPAPEVPSDGRGRSQKDRQTETEVVTEVEAEADAGGAGGGSGGAGTQETSTQP